MESGMMTKTCPKCKGKKVKVFTSLLDGLGYTYHTCPCDECSGTGYVLVEEKDGVSDE